MLLILSYLIMHINQNYVKKLKDVNKKHEHIKHV